MEKTLEEMISQHSYDEIKERVENEVGKTVAEHIFPAVKKALEEGDYYTRYDSLSVGSIVTRCAYATSVAL